MKPNALSSISKLVILALLATPVMGIAQTQNPTQNPTQPGPQVTTQTTTQNGQKPVNIPQDIPATNPKSSDDKDAPAKPASQPVDTSKAKATGSGGKDDVEAIGNRKGVGGRGLGD